MHGVRSNRVHRNKEIKKIYTHTHTILYILFLQFVVPIHIYIYYTPISMCIYIYTYIYIYPSLPLSLFLSLYIYIYMCVWPIRIRPWATIRIQGPMRIRPLVFFVYKGPPKRALGTLLERLSANKREAPRWERLPGWDVVPCDDE